MVQPTLTAYTLTEADKDGHRHFIMQYDATDYNESPLHIDDSRNNPVFLAAKKLVHLEKVTFIHGATIGIPLDGSITISHGSAGVVVHRLPTVITDAAATCEERTVDANYPVVDLKRNAYLFWFYMTILGYAATDDVTLIFSGWVE